MIKFHFDKTKLTPREAQIVLALFPVHWDLRTMWLGEADRTDRARLEKMAEITCVVLRGSLPDLDIRWAWEARPEVPSAG